MSTSNNNNASNNNSENDDLSLLKLLEENFSTDSIQQQHPAQPQNNYSANNFYGYSSNASPNKTIDTKTYQKSVNHSTTAHLHHHHHHHQQQHQHQHQQQQPAYNGSMTNGMNGYCFSSAPYESTTNSDTRNPMTMTPKYNSNGSNSRSSVFDFSPSSSSSSSSVSSVNHSSKNSPLDYLERLALLPDNTSVIDPKSLIKETTDFSSKQLYYDQQQQQPQQHSARDQPQRANNANHKRNLNNDDSLQQFTSSVQIACKNSNDTPKSSNSKKLCKAANHKSSSKTPNSFGSCQPVELSIDRVNTNNYPKMFEDDATKLIPSLNVMNSAIASNDPSDLLDPSNFDFLDFLPELSTNAIDQTISSHNLEKSSSISNNNIGLMNFQQELISPIESIDAAEKTIHQQQQQQQQHHQQRTSAYNQQYQSNHYLPAANNAPKTQYHNSNEIIFNNYL